MPHGSSTSERHQTGGQRAGDDVARAPRRARGNAARPAPPGAARPRAGTPPGRAPDRRAAARPADAAPTREPAARRRPRSAPPPACPCRSRSRPRSPRATARTSGPRRRPCAPPNSSRAIPYTAPAATPPATTPIILIASRPPPRACTTATSADVAGHVDELRVERALLDEMARRFDVHREVADRPRRHQQHPRDADADGQSDDEEAHARLIYADSPLRRQTVVRAAPYFRWRLRPRRAAVTAQRFAR